MKKQNLIYVDTFDGRKATNIMDGETWIEAGQRLCKNWGATSFHVVDYDRRIDWLYSRFMDGKRKT